MYESAKVRIHTQNGRKYLFYSPYTKNSRSSEREFFIQADRLGISSRVSVYIIKGGMPLLYLITPQMCIKAVGLMVYKAIALMIYSAYDVNKFRDNVQISVSKGIPMKFQFKFADKSRIEEILPDCFKILRANMEAIIPDGKPYEEAFSEWYSAVYPALSKISRQMILIFSEDAFIGFFMYFVCGETFVMEEIQIEKRFHKSGVFKQLYSWLLPKLPQDIESVKAYAHKNNIKSQKILEHLGLINCGHNGDYFCYNGNYKTFSSIF